MRNEIRKKQSKLLSMLEEIEKEIRDNSQPGDEIYISTYDGTYKMVSPGPLKYGSVTLEPEEGGETICITALSTEHDKHPRLVEAILTKTGEIMKRFQMYQEKRLTILEGLVG